MNRQEKSHLKFLPLLRMPLILMAVVPLSIVLVLLYKNMVTIYATTHWSPPDKLSGSISRVDLIEVSFPISHTITTGFKNVSSLDVADINGDKKMDVLGAAFGQALTGNDGGISWFENNLNQSDNNDSHWKEYPVNNQPFLGASSVYAADIDRDGDTDILGAAEVTNAIRLWENQKQNGNQITWMSYSVATNFYGASSAIAADIDNDKDKDLDILGATSNAYKIIWWEKNDSLPNNETSWNDCSVKNKSFGDVSSLYTADVDGNGDTDVLAANYDYNYISLFKLKNNKCNDKDWSETKIVKNFTGAKSVIAADVVQGNDSMEILGATESAGKIRLWKEDPKDNALPWTLVYDGTLPNANSVYAADIDSDGDIDILGGGGNTIVWWENMDSSNGTKWEKHPVDESLDGVRSVYAADLDGDCDLDILGAAFSGDIIWWENSQNEACPVYLPLLRKEPTPTPTNTPTSTPTDTPLPTFTPTDTPTPTPTCRTEEKESNKNRSKADRYSPACEGEWIKGALDYDDEERKVDNDDFYPIQVDQSGNLKVNLIGIPQGTNYNLYVYNNNPTPTLIGTSINKGNSDEKITGVPVENARYYLRVYPVGTPRSEQKYCLWWQVDVTSEGQDEVLSGTGQSALQGSQCPDSPPERGAEEQMVKDAAKSTPPATTVSRPLYLPMLRK